MAEEIEVHTEINEFDIQISSDELENKTSMMDFEEETKKNELQSKTEEEEAETPDETIETLVESKGKKTVEINLNPLFEKELDKSSSLLKIDKIESSTLTIEENVKDSSENLSVNLFDELSSLSTEDVSSFVVNTLKYTSHPVSMKVEDSNIKMVDLSHLFLSNKDNSIAPDGFIPNSEIRDVIKKSYIDCFPTKIVRQAVIQDETKQLLEEILLKYLPEDLIAEPVSQMQTIQDMVKLSESRQTRFKPIITMEDNDDQNKDIIHELIAEEELDGMIQNISMKTTKSKRKKYARQITKAAMLNQMERKVKEKEDKRKFDIKREEEKKLVQNEEERIGNKSEIKEPVDIDILDTLEKKVRDKSLITRKKEAEQKNVDASLKKVNIQNLFNLLFKEFGEEQTFLLIYSAIKNNENAINSIDKVVKGRQNRLFILNAVATALYAFPYISYNLGTEDMLINIGLMIEYPQFGDKNTLENHQIKIVDLLGSETKMVKYLAQLSWILTCVTEKLKSLTEKSVPEIILSAFKNVPEDIETLSKLLGSEEKKTTFMNLIRQCKEDEIENFVLPVKIIPKEVVPPKEPKKSVSKKENTIDIFGNLSIEQINLLPALPEYLEERPREFIGSIAIVLQSNAKMGKFPKERDESSPPNIAVVGSDYSMKDMSKSERISHEQISDKVPHSKMGSVTGTRKKPKYHKDAGKKDVKTDEGKKYDVKKSDPTLSIQVVGSPIKMKSDEDENMEVATQSNIKMTDLLQSYFNGLLNKPWWPRDFLIDVTNDSIIIAMIKILHNIAKLAHHSDASQCIIEFKRMFPPSKLTKMEIVKKLYIYFKEDSASTQRSIVNGSRGSHAYYCKRALDYLSLLKSLDEIHIDEMQNEFLRNFGDMKKKVKSSEKIPEEDYDNKEGNDDSADKPRPFNSQYFINKIKNEEDEDYIPSPEVIIAKLIESMKASNDPDEKIIISAAIQDIERSQELPRKIKDDIITQNSVLYVQLKNDLEKKMLSGASDAEQQKIYNQLIKTSNVLNTLVKDSLDSSKDGPFETMPSLKELQDSPELLQVNTPSFIETELQKNKEMEVTEKAFHKKEDMEHVKDASLINEIKPISGKIPTTKLETSGHVKKDGSKIDKKLQESQIRSKVDSKEDVHKTTIDGKSKQKDIGSVSKKVESLHPIVHKKIIHETVDIKDEKRNINKHIDHTKGKGVGHEQMSPLVEELTEEGRQNEVDTLQLTRHKKNISDITTEDRVDELSIPDNSTATDTDLETHKVKIKKGIIFNPVKEMSDIDIRLERGKENLKNITPLKESKSALSTGLVDIIAFDESKSKESSYKIEDGSVEKLNISGQIIASISKDVPSLGRSATIESLNQAIGIIWGQALVNKYKSVSGEEIKIRSGVVELENVKEEILNVYHEELIEKSKDKEHVTDIMTKNLALLDESIPIYNAAKIKEEIVIQVEKAIIDEPMDKNNLTSVITKNVAVVEESITIENTKKINEESLIVVEKELIDGSTFIKGIEDESTKDMASFGEIVSAESEKKIKEIIFDQNTLEKATKDEITSDLALLEKLTSKESEKLGILASKSLDQYKSEEKIKDIVSISDVLKESEIQSDISKSIENQNILQKSESKGILKEEMEGLSGKEKIISTQISVPSTEIGEIVVGQKLDEIQKKVDALETEFIAKEREEKRDINIQKSDDEKIEERRKVVANHFSEDKPLKSILQDVKDAIASKLSPENQKILTNIIASLEATDSIEMADKSDQQLISKMLNELFVASTLNEVEMEHISKEILQQLLEKVQMTEQSKREIEEVLVKDIKNLIANLEEKDNINKDTKKDMMSRIHELTNILKSVNSENEFGNVCMENLIQASMNETTEEVDDKIIVDTVVRRPSLQAHKLLNEPKIVPFVKTVSEEERQIISTRKKIVKRLKDFDLLTKEDLNHPERVLNDLINQRRNSIRDTDKMIQISQAMFSIIHEASKENEQLMEILASDSFSNLIIDMQNLLSETLKQYEVPLALIRCTTNLLILQNLGIYGLEDFENELQKFKNKFPNEVSFEKNPLILGQFSKEDKKLNMSKNELIIDNKLTFLRNVESLKPIDKKRGIEMGLIISDGHVDEEGIKDLESSLYSQEEKDKHVLPVMFSLNSYEQEVMLQDYKKKGELKENMLEIENLVKHQKKQYKKNNCDSITEMARDQRHGSKTELKKIIKKNPALLALTNIGTVLDLNVQPDSHKDLTKAKLPIGESQISKPSITSSKLRKLPPLKKSKTEKHVKISTDTESILHSIVERINKEDRESNLMDTISKKQDNYGSIMNLRSRIKEEICKEYPYLADKINFDDLIDKVKDADIVPKPVQLQTNEFKRLYGHDTTILPFIGKTKSDIGNVLDQGLRALHFNLGPGTLVRAIMEKEGRNIERSKPDWWKEDSSRIDSLIKEDHFQHSEPLKYLTNVQLQHCRMTNRPGCIPVHEWSKITVPASQHNLRPDLFDTLHSTQHCSYSLLANKHLHRHGISIVKHLERYEMIEIINKSIQENAYVRIQNSLLKCLIRVLEEK